jgi:hypothetical protein
VRVFIDRSAREDDERVDLVGDVGARSSFPHKLKRILELTSRLTREPGDEIQVKAKTCRSGGSKDL